MKPEDKLNQEILETRLKIQESTSKMEYSTSEVPDLHPKLESTLEYNKSLDKYLESLKAIVKKYEERRR
jgi:hypothetical protein